MDWDEALSRKVIGPIYASWKHKDWIKRRKEIERLKKIDSHWKMSDKKWLGKILRIVRDGAYDDRRAYKNSNRKNKKQDV